jgi:HlyD family secretion protein
VPKRPSLAIVGILLIGLAWAGQQSGVFGTLVDWASASGAEQPPAAADANYRLAPVGPRKIVETVSATGTLTPVALVSVSSEVSGQIKEIYADFNSEVKHGDAIALIDPVTFEIAVDQGQADVDFADASIAIQTATIDRLTADLDTVRHDLDSTHANTDYARVKVDDAAGDDRRKQALGASGSDADRAHARSALLAAQAQLRAAQATEDSKASVVKSAEAQLRSAQAQLLTMQATLRQKRAALRQAQIDLDRTVIRAPVDGMVIVRNIEVGQTVAVSLQAPTLFTIAQDLRAMQINTAISEADIGRIAVGQRVEFSVDAYGGRMFGGKVTQIRKQPQTTQNVVTYTVVADAANLDLLLMPGMTATTRIVVAETEAPLAVPNSALLFRPPGVPRSDESRVFVASNGAAVPITVKLGATDGAYTEVAGAALHVGAQVILGLAGGTAQKPAGRSALGGWFSP